MKSFGAGFCTARENFARGNFVFAQSISIFHLHGTCYCFGLARVARARHTCVGCIQIVSQRGVENGFIVLTSEDVFFAVKFDCKRAFHIGGIKRHRPKAVKN